MVGKRSDRLMVSVSRLVIGGEEATFNWPFTDCIYSSGKEEDIFGFNNINISHLC